jgi:hypothetical protein
MADKFKFALAVLLLVAGVAGFYLLAEQAMILRVLAVMAGTALAAAVAWKTEQGQSLLRLRQRVRGRGEEGRLAFAQGNHADHRSGIRLRGGDGSLSLADRQESGMGSVRPGSWVEKV